MIYIYRWKKRANLYLLSCEDSWIIPSQSQLPSGFNNNPVVVRIKTGITSLFM